MSICVIHKKDILSLVIPHKVWLFPLQIHYKAQAEEQLDDGGQRRRKTNMEQRGVGGAADEVGHRHTHAEGTCDALQHDEPRLADAVVVTCVAEEDGGKQSVNGVGTQVIRRSGDDFRVRGEDARQQVAVEVCEEEHPYADDEGHHRAVHSLQKQGEQHRQRKNDQRLQNFALDKSIFLLFLHIAPRLCCATTKSRIRSRYFNPPSYPAIVSYEQIALR